MNCYNHRDKAAIGLCKSCGKAICADCLTEIPDGLACKGSCEERAKMINQIIDANSKVMSVAGRQLKTTAYLSMFMGFGFLAFAYIESLGTDSFFPNFLGLMGIAFVVSGVLRLTKKQTYPQLESKKG